MMVGKGLGGVDRTSAEAFAPRRRAVMLRTLDRSACRIARDAALRTDEAISPPPEGRSIQRVSLCMGPNRPHTGSNGNLVDTRQIDSGTRRREVNQ